MIKNIQTIPEEWAIKSFNDCFDIAPKLSGLKKSEYESVGKYPIIDQAKADISGYTDDTSLIQKKVPSIVFGDHTRILKYIDFPYVLGNDGTKVLWAKKGFNQRFLYYLLSKLDIPNTGYNRHFKYLENENFKTPSEPEQDKIAEILGTVDQNIKKTEQVIQATEKLKRGLMHKFLTKGIGKDCKFKKYRIGELCNVKTGGTPNTQESEYWGGNIPWMASGEINQKRVRHTTRRITKLGLENCNSEILPKATVMIALAGQGKTRGTVAVLEIESSCNQSLAGINSASRDLLINEYLFYNLESRYEELRDINGNEGRGGLNMELIRNIEIGLPNVEIQKQIADILSAVDEKISTNKKLKDQLLRLKKGLMQDLLTGKKLTI